MSAQPQPTMRRLDDIDAIRERILDNARNALRARYPVENDRYRLELADVDYDEREPFSLKQQKEALLSNRSLHKNLYGTWRLVDKASNAVVDEKPRTIVMSVPWMTQRGTVIYNGSEYAINHQMRLKPGAYARRKANGVLETHFNIQPGTGTGFRVYMDPDTGVFKMRVNNADVPLYRALVDMGVPHSKIEGAWGKDLAKINADASSAKDSAVLYHRLTKQPIAEQDAGRGLIETFGKMRVDPSVMSSNLGRYM